MENRTNNSDDINIIKAKIIKLFNDKKNIHVTINVKRKKVKNAISEIVGVYKNFFNVKSYVNLYYEEFSISYIDILIGNVSISELSYSK